MSFEAALKAHLAGDSAIAALVADRIAPQPLPAATMPAITYIIAGDALQTDLDGLDGSLNQILVQVDCWSGSHDEVKQLAELVRIRMQTAAASFKALPRTAIEDYEPKTKRHRMSRDFSCWYRIS